MQTKTVRLEIVSDHEITDKQIAEAIEKYILGVKRIDIDEYDDSPQPCQGHEGIDWSDLD